MSQELGVHLLHGSADVIIPDVIGRNEDLFGYVIPGSPSRSGALTTDWEFAVLFAREKVIYIDGAIPVVLHYNIPIPYLLDQGMIGGNIVRRAFATTFAVHRNDLSQAFRDGIGLDDLETNEEKKDWEFFRVPAQFLVNVEKLENPFSDFFGNPFFTTPS